MKASGRILIVALLITPGCGRAALEPTSVDAGPIWMPGRSVASEVRVSPAGVTLRGTDATTILAAHVLDDRGRAYSNAPISWTSSDTVIAIVDQAGRVSARLPGRTRITARAGSATDTAAVTVIPDAPCESIAGNHIAVSDAASLTRALNEAQPGDVIRMADGSYPGPFHISRSGSASSRIVLCGGRGAVLEAGGVSGRTVLRLHASHWTLQGFTVTRGLRGILVDSGSYNRLNDLEIHGTGQEAVHFRNFSSHNVIEGSRIHDTGLVEARYGEGVYIGTSDGDWPTVTGGAADRSDYNQVLNNTFGPNIRAENIDVKTGTTGGVLMGNVLSGEGTQEDDIVEVKGNRYRVVGNRASRLAAGHAFRVRSTLPGWGNDNEFAENRIDLQGTGYGFSISSGTSGNVVQCSNVVSNAGGFANVSCVP